LFEPGPEDRVDKALHEESEGDSSEAIDLNIIKKTSKMSEYALRREKNIAHNKELLKETMLGSGYSDLMKDLKNETANKRKATKNRKKTNTTKQADGQNGGM
jgi:hypothetical protein